MPTYKIRRNSGADHFTAKTTNQLIVELARDLTKVAFSTGVTDLTDSSGGTASSTTVVAASTAMVNVAASGSSLASKATAESAIATVKDALVELYAKANAFATKASIANVTYSGGGAAADGVISAVTVATTGATTGAKALETNAQFVQINQAFYVLGVLTNNLLRATAATELVLTQDSFVATIPAIAGTVGTAADPGITKVAFDVELAKMAANVATIATKINALNNGLTAASITVV